MAVSKDNLREKFDSIEKLKNYAETSCISFSGACLEADHVALGESAVHVLCQVLSLTYSANLSVTFTDRRFRRVSTMER